MSGNLNKTKVLAVLGLVLSVAILGFSVPAQAGSVYLWASGAGDGTLYYNTKYGGNTYYTDNPTMTASLYFGAPYGNDYNNIYIEIPIAALLGATLTGATLQLDSLGAWTDYYYGSAYVRHLNPGSLPTGNIAVDNPLAWGSDTSWLFYDSSAAPPWDGSAGIKSFDVSAEVQADLTAGRSYSSFSLEASRDTYATIYASETSGQGPRIYAQGDFVVPIPGAVWLLGSGLIGLAGLRKWRK